jgi:hypothetical protein
MIFVSLVSFGILKWAEFPRYFEGSSYLDVPIRTLWQCTGIFQYSRQARVFKPSFLITWLGLFAYLSMLAACFFRSFFLSSQPKQQPTFSLHLSIWLVTESSTALHSKL